LGVALAHQGNLTDATPHLLRAVELAPQDAGYRYNLGRVLAAQSRFAEALAQFAEAATLTNREDPAILQMLAAMESETGQFAGAVTTAQAAVELARQQQNGALAAQLEANLARYRAQAQSGAQSGTGGPR
jgi:Flp pilus assembly protein TadD